MISDRILFLWLLTFISGSLGFNVLMISVGAAGNVIPMFELAKAMKYHNITFITQQYAQSYIDFKSYKNLSSFHLIYTNDSSDAFITEKTREQEVIAYFANHSIFDGFSYMVPRLGDSMNSLLNKTVHILMLERFDVIITTATVIGINILCKETNTPCVIQSAESFFNMFDINLPNSYSLLSTKQITEFKYRMYNIAFTLRLIMTIYKTLIQLFYTIVQSFPRISGPFYESFTLRNLLSKKSKCLHLISVSPTFYPPSYSHHYTKYLGPYIDESSIDDIDNDLTRWIKSKPNKSIIYVALGSTGILNFDRMKNLIHGLTEFILQTDVASILFAFRNANYDMYQNVVNKMKNDEYRRVLFDNQRVQIETQFVQQKWILKQNSVNLFISHCGMGSSLEGLYFQKPILCLPLHTDQFMNAITIDHSRVGQSLFTPPSLLQSLKNPHDFHDYTFSATSVTMKLSMMWRNMTYEKAIEIISLEMKHVGGVRQAVKEIEFFVNLNGDLDRYAPFKSTLSFYQQYMFDVLIIYIVLPVTIIIYLFGKCCKRNRKEKRD
ncbi:unnamed protein product [Rotaria sordida]|uniref:Glucuronosyltransferase n=1 Tax=Rotaria sordida TaxID=392033 RepID=A0A819AT10_9BILA|nr:unnamed protein product [Rotaria sordida]